MNDRCDRFHRTALDKVWRPAYTLVELMVVIAVIGIIASVVITTLNPGIHDKLDSVAQIVIADLDYARNLAVSNGSTYKITFDPGGDSYVLTHDGSNPALDNLPSSPFGQSTDPPDQQTTVLSSLPAGGPKVSVYGVYKLTPSAVLVNDVSFGSFGETTRPEQTVIELTCGYGENKRIRVVYIDPITGLATLGPFLNVPQYIPGFGS